MTKDCSLNYKFSTWKLQGQNMLFFCFCFDIQNNLWTQHVLSWEFSCTQLVIQRTSNWKKNLDFRNHFPNEIFNFGSLWYQAKTEYTLEQQNLVKNTFSITTKQNGFLIQTLNEKDVSDWLYAINPLLAGKIRYVPEKNQWSFCYIKLLERARFAGLPRRWPS